MYGIGTSRSEVFLCAESQNELFNHLVKGQFQSTTFLSIVPFHSSLKTFLKNKFNSVHVQGRSFQRIEFKKEWILKWKNSYLHFLYLSSTNSIKL